MLLDVWHGMVWYCLAWDTIEVHGSGMRCTSVEHVTNRESGQAYTGEYINTQ
jgi:hypothetical protein